MRRGLWVALVACACEAPRVAEPTPAEPTPRVEAAVAGPLEVRAAEPRAEAREVRSALPERLPAGLRWVAIGGGATPEFNQVSIEQDLGLAQEVFGTGGALLFAGGVGSPVQVEDPAPRGDDVTRALAEFFAPRGGRGASYRPTALAPLGAATAGNAKALLRAALAEPGPPLVVYLAGHGEPGGALSLWGQEPLTADALGEVVAAGQRRAVVVATSCYSGGLAELALRGADGRGGLGVRGCGLFAATAEREASGCDPNPDRAAQESYALHFLHALRGEDRDGVGLAGLDLDGDGAVSLLEAHARARVAGGGLDVPTTSSERWLREHAPRRGRAAEVRLPEEEAVLTALTRELGYEGREEASAGDLERMVAALEAAYERLNEASAGEEAAYRAAAAELLARFPVIDDPWHPDFAATVAREREVIRAVLSGVPMVAYRRALQAVEAARDEVSGLLVRSARLERLVRARETRALAGRLKARGGPAWRAYEELLACERTTLTAAPDRRP